MRRSLGVQMPTTRRGKGAATAPTKLMPMPKHLALPNLRPELFEQWLRLFKQTTQEFDSQPFQLHVNMLAYRIASRLWAAYQMQYYPDKPLLALKAP